MGNCGHGSEGHCGCSSCRCCTPSDYIAQAGYSVITDENTAASYAIRAGSPSNTDALFYPKTIIMSHRIAWWQKSPGDCGQQASINTPLLPKISSIVGETGAGIGAATAVASFGGLAGVAGGIAAAGPFAAVAAAVLVPLSFISQHHAAAVRKETSVGCAVSVSWNQFATKLEQSLVSGSIGTLDANQYLDSAVSQIMSMISSIAIKKGDAGYMMRYGLAGLQQLYKDREIARLAAMAVPQQQQPVQNAALQQQQPSILTTNKISNITKAGIALVAVLVVAALLVE